MTLLVWVPPKKVVRQRFGCREFVWEMNPKTTDDTMQKMRQRGREGKCGLPLEYATSEDSPENCCLPQHPPLERGSLGIDLPTLTPCWLMVAPRGARAKPQAENKCNSNTWVRSWQNVIKGLSQVKPSEDRLSIHRSAPVAWSPCFLSAFLLICVSCLKAESQEKLMHNA